MKRRTFLYSSSALGASVMGLKPKGLDGKEKEILVYQPNPIISVQSDGKIFITITKSEMGQGVRTSMPMILAEEMGVDPAIFILQQASPSSKYKGLSLGTGGSTSLKTMWIPLRKAGLEVKDGLLRAAEIFFKVSQDQLSIRGSLIVTEDGRSVSFGDLVPIAVKLESNKNLEPPKKVSSKNYLGKDRKRIDAPAIVNGSARYGIDIRPKAMKFAAVKRPPVWGNTLKSYDAKAALSVPGVRRVEVIPTGVAVVADNTFAAFQGREKLKVRWNAGPHTAFDSDDYQKQLTQNLKSPGRVARKEGSPPKPNKDLKTIEATYSFPFHAHVPLEPMNATAHVTPTETHVWVGSQWPDAIVPMATKITGHSSEKINVHIPLLGGGFGRRSAPDAAVEVIELANILKTPVQIIWDRADDLRNGYYHPASIHGMSAVVDSGRQEAYQYKHKVSTPSILRSSNPKSPDQAVIGTELLGARDLPYGIDGIEISYHELPIHIPLWWWRAIQFVPNIYARECFIDEIAQSLNRDPLEYRELLLSKSTQDPATLKRLANAISIVKEKSNWPNASKSNRALGVACMDYEGTTVAQVAEVSVSKNRFKIHKIFTVIDCGLVVNPLGVKSQVEGAIVWALSALKSQIHFKKGRVVEKNYKEYPVLRYADMPEVDTTIVDSERNPQGVGEPPVPCVMPAVLNAIVRAGGPRLRSLPLTKR